MIPVIAGLAAVWAATKVGGYLEDKLDPGRHERKALRLAREQRAAYLKTREGRTMIYNAYLEYKKRLTGGDTSVAVGLRIRDLEYRYIHTGELILEQDDKSTQEIESTQDGKLVQDDESEKDTKSESENV